MERSDGLAPRDFALGFGSHTPVTIGHAKVARYGCMEPRVLDKLRGRGLHSSTFRLNASALC